MRRISIALVSLLAAVSAQAQAQVVHARTTNGRTASAVAIIPAPPPVVVVGQNQSLFFPPGTPVFFNLPVVVLPDGRVFANFGRGFEQVIRNCASVVTSSFTTVIQPTVSQPTVVQPQPGVSTATPVYATPSVPSQTTASQVLLSPAVQQTLAAQQPQVIQSNVSTGQSCWGTSWNGQVFIARP